MNIPHSSRIKDKILNNIASAKSFGFAYDVCLPPPIHSTESTKPEFSRSKLYYRLKRSGSK